jgi:hypothetical protein
LHQTVTLRQHPADRIRQPGTRRRENVCHANEQFVKPGAVVQKNVDGPREKSDHDDHTDEKADPSNHFGRARTNMPVA